MRILQQTSQQPVSADATFHLRICLRPFLRHLLASRFGSARGVRWRRMCRLLCLCTKDKRLPFLVYRGGFLFCLIKVAGPQILRP